MINEEEKRKGKIGVVLLNLGGPERLEDVRPFLYNLFSDRQIIRLGPSFMQKPIAWLIAKRRAPKSAESYKLIGGGSPLNKITTEQGKALETHLNNIGDFKVTMAMRYWQPFAEQTLAELGRQGITKIVALTLYPHYSIATTGSSIDDLHLKANRLPTDFTITEIESWPDQTDYIQSLANNIIKGLEQCQTEAQVVYSAHSLPVKFIEEGDPYLDHLHRTIHAVEKITGKTGDLCFQSRSGPVEWLAPSTPDTLERLAKEDCNQVLMVPISFVSDHVETLYEIDIQYKELADQLGIDLRRTESLNVDPVFIEGLKNLVKEACQEMGWL